MEEHICNEKLSRSTSIKTRKVNFLRIPALNQQIEMKRAQCASFSLKLFDGT